MRYIQNPDSATPKLINVGQVMYCKCALDMPGFVRDDERTYAACKLNRTGDDLICSNCSVVRHMLSEEEVWNSVTLPVLHFTDRSELSHKVGPAKWNLIKQYFEYASYADLAESEDDQDNFENAAYYESLGRGGEWTLKYGVKVETVEEILGILPENRRAVLDGKEKAEQEDAHAEAAEKSRVAHERNEGKRTLFGRDQGEYIEIGESFDGNVKGEEIPWGEGFNIYGGGEEFVIETGGKYIWLVSNNGADGDDWSRNNIRTGGAGGVGRRYPATPERMDFLRSLPGGENIGVSKEEIKHKLVLEMHNKVLQNNNESFRALFPNPPGSAKRSHLCVWVKLGNSKIGLSFDEKNLFILTRDFDHGAVLHADIEMHGNAGEVSLRYDPTPEQISAVKALWPEWVTTTQVGRFTSVAAGTGYIAENSADLLRIMAVWQAAVNVDVKADLGATLRSIDKKLAIWSDGMVTRLGRSYNFCNMRRDWAEYEANNSKLVAEGKSPLTYGTDPDHDPYAVAGFPTLPPLSNTESVMSEAASKLVNIALGLKTWRENDRYKSLMDIQSYTSQNIDSGKHDSGRSGTFWNLQKLEIVRASTIMVAATADSWGSSTEENHQTLYLLEKGWWAMGEDGEADSSLYLFESEAAARAEQKDSDY